ncbi:MAG: HD domain-containing phosphohydrolase [bacterium]
MDENIEIKVESLIRDLARASQVRAMYNKEHKLTKESINKLFLSLTEILSQKKELIIGVIGNEIAYNKKPFYEISKYLKGFIEHLKIIKAEKITFTKGITAKELEGFIDVINMNSKAIESAGGLESLFAASNIQNITLGKIDLDKEEKREAREGDIESAKKNLQNGLQFLETLKDKIGKTQAVDMAAVRNFVNSIVGNLLKNKFLLLVLGTIKSHDEYTLVHEINVAVFTLLQAEALGMDQSSLGEIGMAALLHDTGKVMVSGEILRKKAALDKDEWKAISLHPAYGAKILFESADTSMLAVMAAFEHHMRYDMTGYPKKLYGTEANLVSMMVTIADFYDALRSKRAYRKQEMVAESVYEEMIKFSGKFFHPVLLDNFFTIIGVYPPGTLVELDNKAIGLVVRGNVTDIKRPYVEIIYNPNGEKEKSSYVINLLEKDGNGDYKRSITKSILPAENFNFPQKYLVE